MSNCCAAFAICCTGKAYTIRGVQRILREQGSKFVQAVWLEGAPQPPHGASDDEEFIEETQAAPEPESRGLRDRLTSLIGRDLGERQDNEARHEPRLKSAPEVRVAPTDRVVHAVSVADDPDPPMQEQHPPVQTMQPPIQHVPAPASSGGLARDDLRKLHAVLHELAECRKLIDAAATR